MTSDFLVKITGILDTVDYDSISYEMTDPLRGSDQAESFQGSYTKDRPIQFLGFPNNTLPFPAGFHLIPKRLTVTNYRYRIICYLWR